MVRDRTDFSGDFRESKIDFDVHNTSTYQHAQPMEVDADTIAQAEKLLAALPVHEVSELGALPQHSRMPLARNPLFVGREADLREIAGALKASGTAAIGQIAAATGLGGIGKTQSAAEFVHRYGRYFAGGVFWLSFADAAAVPAEVANCGGRAVLALHDDFDKLSLADQVKLVLSAWQRPLPCLLVFDNCEDEELLARWRPPTGGARVLVTSRRGAWSKSLDVYTLSLGVLEREESVSLLRKHREDLSADDAGLAAIAKELGDLPLALHLAGSFLGRYRHAEMGAPEDYLARLRGPGLLALLSESADGPSPTGHEQHMARTFALSYGQLSPEVAVDALGRSLLARAAYFAPGEPIPRSLLRASLAISEDDTEAEQKFEDAITRVDSLGLLECREDGSLALHRLLGMFVRGESAEGEAAQDAVERAVGAEAARINKMGLPAPLLAWQPHLRHVADGAAERESELAGLLSNELGYHLKQIADYPGAKAAYERALKIDEKVHGPDHPEVAIDVNNLGDVFQAEGDLAGAKAAYERALKIDEKAYGSDHPNVGIRVNNLGSVLESEGDLVGAKAAFERALKIDEKAYGPDHPTVAIRVNNLGAVLQAEGDLVGAKAAYERALEIGEKANGPDHPTVAIRVNNLGGVLEAEGDLAGANAAYERALRIFEASLGPDHPNTQLVRRNLDSLQN